jgi:hypothetical protein
MKFPRTLLCAVLVFALISLQTACKKETDTFDLYPIKVTSVDTLGTTKLSWNKIESSDFIEYIIVRSSKDSIANFSELNTSGGALIVGRISNAKQSEFFDFNTASTINRLYYRVFARLKNRTISSANYVLNSDLSLLNVPFVGEIIQDEFNPNLVYLNGSNTGQITLYDLAKDSILAQSTPTFSSSSRIFLASDRGNNAEIIQVVYGSKRIIFRDAKTLDIKTTMDFTYYVYGLDATSDGFIGITTDEYNKQFQMIRLSDHRVISTQSNIIENYSFYAYGSNLYKVPNSTTFLVLEGSSNLNFARLTYDAQGNFTPAKLAGRLLGTSSSTLSFNDISAKGGYYYFYGQLYAAPFDPTKPLNIFIQSNYSDFIFKQDESKFYTIRQAFNGTNTNVIEEYNLPSGKLQRTLNSRVIGRIIPYKDKIYVFGFNNSSSTQQTILQKIQL